MPRVKLDYNMGAASEADFSESESGFGHHDRELYLRAQEIMTEHRNLTPSKAKHLAEKEAELAKERCRHERELPEVTRAQFIDDSPYKVKVQRAKRQILESYKFEKSDHSVPVVSDFSNGGMRSLARKVKSLDKDLRKLEADFSNHMTEYHEGVRSVKTKSSDFNKDIERNRRTIATSKQFADYSNSRIIDEWGDMKIYTEFNNSEIVTGVRDADTIRITNESYKKYMKGKKLKDKLKRAFYKFKFLFKRKK